MRNVKNSKANSKSNQIKVSKTVSMEEYNTK